MIMEKVYQKRKEEYDHHLEGEKEYTLVIEDVKKDKITDGYEIGKRVGSS